MPPRSNDQAHTSVPWGTRPTHCGPWVEAPGLATSYSEASKAARMLT